MKVVSVISIFLFCLSFHQLYCQEINIPDDNLKLALLANGVDENNDDKFQLTEVLKVRELNLQGYDVIHLDGLNNFTSLKKLNCSDNQIFEINLSGLVNLEEFYCSNNKFKSLEIPFLSELRIVHCDNNNLNELILPPFIGLEELNCASNASLRHLELSTLSQLQRLEIQRNDFEDLDVSGLSSLVYLNASHNSLPNFHLNEHESIETLILENCKIETFNLNKYPNLITLILSLNHKIEVDFGTDHQIESLNLNKCSLNQIDVSSLEKLRDLSLLINNLTEIDLSNNELLEKVFLSTNQLTAINLNDNLALEFLDLNYNDLYALELSHLVNLTTLRCKENNISKLLLPSSNTLEELDCSNNLLSTLALHGNSKLKEFNCALNLFQDLDLSQLTELFDLNCSYNLLTSLNLQSNTFLTYLDFSDNDLTTISFEGLESLRDVKCLNNRLNVLKLEFKAFLRNLNCSSNLIRNLDFRGTTNIRSLVCSNNVLTLLDLSNFTNLDYLDCSENALQSLFIKNNYRERELLIAPNNLLAYVCADEDDFSNVLSSFQELNLHTNFNLETTCPFTFGGNHLTAQGKVLIEDEDAFCQDEYPVSFLNFTFEGETFMKKKFSNSNGNFDVKLNEEVIRMIPLAENEAYFSVQPSEFLMDQEASAFTNQVYCLKPNGDFSDLEILMFPSLDRSVSDLLEFKILLRNKGTIAKDAIVTLRNDFIKIPLERTDLPPFVESNTEIKWKIENLKPLETKEIVARFYKSDLHDSNPEQINFHVSVRGEEDIVPEDNVLKLITSFDDLDERLSIIPLKGRSVFMPEEYQYFVFKYKNTTSSKADRHFIQVSLDQEVFDITTLVPLCAGLDFSTRVLNDNTIEFLFEDELTNNEPANQNYVVFKIKVHNRPIKSELRGAVFIGGGGAPSYTNSSEIVIHYNYDEPLALEISPNPASDFLMLGAIETITELSVYNASGSLILNERINAKNKRMDLKKLSSGLYYFKVIVGNQTITKKLLILK